MRNLLPVIHRSLNSTYGLSPGKPQFSSKEIRFIPTKLSNGKAYLYRNMHACREVFINLFMQYVIKEGPNYICVTTCMINRDLGRDKHLNRLLIALRLINKIEIYAKWPKSELCSVRNDDKLSENVFLYSFVGADKWCYSTHMISLYLLFIRFFYFQSDLFRCSRSINDIRNNIKKSYNLYECDNYGEAGEDIERITEDFDKYLLIMRRFRSIFKGIESKDCFSEEIYENGTSDMYLDGIDNLLYDASHNMIISDRVRKLIDNFKK